MYYNCVKFHKNSISSLVGVALTRYMPPPFRESISWIISPFKFWTATIFLHAHLQVVYYKCVKFHKNPTSRLGGVALTRYMDGRGDSYIPPQTLFAGGIINNCAKSAWYARRQHSYNICKDFLSHNSWMKNLNFNKKYTDRKSIISNNCAKFEVNWPRGSQFTAWHRKNHLQFDE